MTSLPFHPHLTHPRTGERLRAIGFTRRGPVWPQLGAAPDDPATDPPADPAADPAPADPKPGDDLGDAGKKALAAERDARKAAEKELAKFRKADADRADADRSDLEKAQARQMEAEQKAAAAVQRAVKAEVRAAAAGWADPSDAPRYLDDLAKYLNDAGDIDTETIAADLAAVLKDKPHLGAQGATPKTPKPDPSQGPRGEPASRPKSLGEAIAGAYKRS